MVSRRPSYTRAMHAETRYTGSGGLPIRADEDLVAGSGLEFQDRGEHELRGVPGSWRLYALAA